MSDSEQYNILVVDDEAITRKLFKAAAKLQNMKCDLAVNGKHAMMQLEINDYDAVITDIQMPEVHGHTVIISLLEREDRPMVIAATAVEEPLIIKDLIRRGIDEVAFKPLNYELFAVKVKALLDRRKRLNSKLQAV